MYHHHLVRVGALGHIGRFTPVDTVEYPRGTKVILRTARGLETGEVLATDSRMAARGSTDGSILRAMTAEDRLLHARLNKHKTAALADCAQRLQELGSSAVLMDVELLFDGSGLYFYFLGDVPPEVEGITEQLAEVYEARSQIRQFTDSVLTGCGPGCGTDAAAGSGCGTSGGCSSCSAAMACSTRSR